MPTRLRPRVGPARRATRATPGGLGRWGHGPRGQALAEFALIVPIFVLLAMTAVDFGRAFYTYEAIANAAREGARYCAVYQDSAGASSRALGELGGTVPSATVATSPACIFGSSGSALTCDSTSSTATPGSPVILCVSATFQPITPLVDAAIGIANGGSIAFNASAVMMVP